MGEGFVRFALIENEHRTRQAIRCVKQFLNAGVEDPIEVSSPSS
jgi:hypothetical protein